MKKKGGKKKTVLNRGASPFSMQQKSKIRRTYEVCDDYE